MAQGIPLSAPMDARLSNDIAALWAKSKPPHPLWCHLLDVAAVAFELLPYFGPIDPLTQEWTATLVGLHDLGKADPLFQGKVPELSAQLPRDLFDDFSEDLSKGFRHEARSADLLLRLVLQSPRSTGSSRLAKAAARALAGHHGHVDPRSRTPSEEPSRATVAHWDGYRRALVDLVRCACGAQDAPPARAAHADSFGVRLLGLTIAADWIGSNESLFQKPSGGLSPADYYAAARRSAVIALRRVGLIALDGIVGTPRTPPTWSDSWPQLSPRSIQCLIADIAASDIEPGLAIIEAPMGIGKTEGAIHLSECWSARRGLVGAYIALPTQATSNQMHDRYSEFLKRRAARPLLVHGMAWLVDDPAEVPPPRELDPGAGADSVSERDSAASWLRNLRRALLAPYAVGTVDQILLAGLAVRFGVLRLLGLGNKVLIVDEVHACDTYMRARLERVLSWCRVLGTPVILLSATLPRRQRESLIQAYLGDGAEETDQSSAELPANDPYPLVTLVNGRSGEIRCMDATAAVGIEGSAKTIELAFVQGALSDEVGRGVLADRVLDSVNPGGCAVVIVNTVREAQMVYRSLAERAPADCELLLFHARFPAWRRKQLETAVVDRFGKPAALRPSRAVLVATQVVEQSLDLDFDVMFTEIAPIDLVLQRAGRLWRHPRERRPTSSPELYVLVPAAGSLDFGRSEYVYARLHLLLTLGALEGRRSIELPRDFRPLVESVYGAPLAACGSIPIAELQKAAREEQLDVEMAAAEALKQLIGPPFADQFRYPCQEFTVEDAEEDRPGDNFRAQTRLGDSVSVFALTRPEDLEIWNEAASGRPHERTLRQLFLTRVSLRPHWLDEGVRSTQELGRVCGMRGLDLTRSRGGGAGIGYDAELGLYRERETVWKEEA